MKALNEYWYGYHEYNTLHIVSDDINKLITYYEKNLNKDYPLIKTTDEEAHEHFKECEIHHYYIEEVPQL